MVLRSSATISGERLVNFDVDVVVPSGTNPISYNKATNSCALVYHQHTHIGGVAAAVKATSK
jgi:hypothetical protein